MKKILLTLALPMILGTGILSAGDAGLPVTGNEPAAEPCLWDPHRPDSHAPIGVMGDHTHEAGEWMLSYRWMHMNMDGHRAGSDSLTNQQVYDFGYDVAATRMDMNMHMWGLMFAPTDWLTLTGMINYVEKDMELLANPHAHGHGHGGGHTGAFGHSSRGLGDITVGGLVKVYDANCQRVHLNLGLVLPTAEVDKKQNGVFLPYGMQLGSGTWNLRPGVTYLGQAGDLSWGGQALATFHLENANNSGFSYGDDVNVTAWTAYQLCDCLSLSARLSYTWQDDIDGHYNGPHGHAAPPHFPENYGGHVFEAGLGLNYYIRNGMLKGHRLAVEGIVPLAQDLNGVGMDREFGVIVGWQKAF